MNNLVIQQLLERTKQRSLLSIQLKEGRNRQIRRIAAGLGHRVIDLQRVGLAGISLDNLPEGSWRRLRQEEWQPLLNARPCA